MNNSILNWVEYFSVGFSIISFLIGLICIRTIRKYLIPLFLIVFLAVCAEIISLIARGYSINNLIVFRIYTSLEFSLLFVFYMLFYRQYSKFKILYMLLPLFYLITFIDYKVNGIKEMDNFSSTVEASFFIIASLLSFFFIIRHLIFENIIAMPFFWINSAILIYFSGIMLLYVFSKAFNKEEYNFLYGFINSPLNIIYNSLISIGFWKSRNK